MRDDRARLLDILEAIERIERYAAKGIEAFRNDELIQNWMVRNIELIGEAARSLSQRFRNQTPNVPWSYIIGMRNVLAHRYFDIDFEIVWKVVSTDIPRLKPQIEDILNNPPRD
ncbi:MAG: DUF86 domain-containing protein [Thermodesulfobacteriota bacterium]